MLLFCILEQSLCPAVLTFGVSWALWGLSSIPDPHPLGAGSTPSCDNHRCPQILPSILWQMRHLFGNLCSFRPRSQGVPATCLHGLEFVCCSGN